MAKKKYSFVVERIYRGHVEMELDLDELKKEHPLWDDVELLIGAVDFDAAKDYTLDEQGVRVIEEDEKEIFFE